MHEDRVLGGSERGKTVREMSAMALALRRPMLVTGCSFADSVSINSRIEMVRNLMAR